MSWQYVSCPPYAGLWWGHTKHGTVELVRVRLKSPLPPSSDLPFVVTPVDPYTYEFGEGASINFEAVGRRRWTHWQPVVSPPPPANPDPVAAGLSDGPTNPLEGESVWRTDDAHPPRGPVRGVGRSVEHYSGLPFEEIQRQLQQEAAFQAEQQERLREEIAAADRAAGDASFADTDALDREDASAYDKDRYASAEAFAGRLTTPAAMMAEAEARARSLLAEPISDWERELKRLKALSPVLHALVKHAIDSLRKSTGGGDKAA